MIPPHSSKSRAPPGQVSSERDFIFRFRPCELALALLCTEFQRQVADYTSSGATALMGFISELQKYCSISSSEFCSVLGEVVTILDKYNAAGQVPHRQRLVWKLSNRSDSRQTNNDNNNKIILRTLKQLRPTDRLRPTLPRICEETIADKSGMSRLRSHSECSLESDISDTDGSYKASASDTESDIEMEVSRVS